MLLNEEKIWDELRALLKSYGLTLTSLEVTDVLGPEWAPSAEDRKSIRVECQRQTTAPGGEVCSCRTD